jgi:hypothetical protein
MTHKSKPLPSVTIGLRVEAKVLPGGRCGRDCPFLIDTGLVFYDWVCMAFLYLPSFHREYKGTELNATHNGTRPLRCLACLVSEGRAQE